MGLSVGKVRGFEIRKNRAGVNNVLLLQVEVTDPDDIQTIEFYQASGDDHNPPTDSLVAFLQAGNAWKIALGADDGIIPDSEPGEKKIYSSAGGVIKAFLKLFKTGIARLEAAIINIVADESVNITAPEVNINDIAQFGESDMELGGNTDNAVRFSVLLLAFNQLKAEFNAHTHGGVESGGSTTATPAPSTADITLAKIENIKTS